MTGTKVTFCVTIPNIVGLATTAANSAILNANLTVGTTTGAYSCTAAANVVISQDTGCVASGTPVNYTYSLGTNLVPNVVNSALADANTALINAGYTIGTITYQCSNTVAAGSVISTNPATGVQTACGSAVAISVSTGTCPVVDCFPSSDPNYGQWVSVGKPASWCGSNLRQCHGDADNATQLVGKSNYWVSPNDLAILVAGWEKAYTNPTACPWISADFDHKGQVVGKSTYRVSPNDLAILVQYWEKATVPADCPHN